ncbi:hypothetical protein ONS95_014533 [Cadophora gregata]|uniref:uncharacterized protein n=3 Tax=Cadophora gregata TaxID=51156 RepID=UPI0026DB0E73|nr:uncharacterized protein ONS95_014533 [Cadophora gregata]KAK0112802.1 hypothetical protein ONS95_014533 [Cadophora gregata]
MVGPNGQYSEPIAICGMAMRLPRGVKTPEAYWDVLVNGKDLREPVPISRYNIKGFDDSMGKTNIIQQKEAYFLEDDLAAFDAGLFTMTRNELEKADPQQRLLLMVVRECLESAGVTDYRGSVTGFFVGTFSEDWLQTQSREEQHATGYVLTGHLDPMLANRVCFEYDLRGPCYVVKTACSSSMIAMHNAVRAVQNRDCDAAIISGSNLNMGPITTASMTQEGIMSPEGSCKTFDARADGYGRGEAVNAIYIKPLCDAIRDGNPIRAVIRNTACNQDGQSVGLFATSIVAQEALMRKAYAGAGLNPVDTAMVECHGTGTPVGDPVEAISVGNVFGVPSGGVYIGSVKPNLGHAEAAAGISSLMKAVLSLEHKIIPPNIKFEIPNPRIPFEEKKITVPVKPMPWPEGKAHRISVNSFGIGGTNAHIILDSAEQYLKDHAQSQLSSQLAVISANSQDSLKAGIENLKQYVASHPDCLPDLAYTLSRRREHFKWRSFATLSNLDTVNFAPPTNKPVRQPTVVMVFSGQGSQWPQMGHDLLASLPGFKEDVMAMDEILQSLEAPFRPQWTAIEELTKPTGSSQLHRAELAQPLSTVVQIGLVNALKSLGVRPQAVVGHSSGEIAAAYAADALTLREAVTAAYYRGYVSKDATTQGGMAAIGLGAEETRQFLPDRVVVACENSPASTTISGDADQLRVALANIQAAQPDTFARALKVEMAYHSHHMVALSEAYESRLGDEFTSFTQGRETLDGELQIPLFSSLHAKKITDAREFGPQYWIDNLTHPVLFNSAVQGILQEVSNPLFLEIGPHSTLQGPLREICTSLNKKFDYIPTMLRGKNCTESFLSAVGQLYQQDINVDFAALYPSGRVLTNLPAYPWSMKETYWYEPRISREWRLRPHGQHELLGRKVAESTTINPSWRLVLNLDHVPWIADHKVRENIVVPFAAYVSMVGEAIRQFTGVEEGYKVKDIQVTTGLVLTETPKEIVTALRQQPNSEYYAFNIASHNGSTWITHCEGLVKAVENGAPAATEAPVELHRAADVGRWFETFAKVGFNYGPKFQLLDNLSAATTNDAASALVNTGDEIIKGPFLFHPTTMDACLQLAIIAGSKGLPRNYTELKVPTAIDELEVYRGVPSMRAVAHSSDDGSAMNIECVADGKALMRIRGLHFTLLPDEDAGPQHHTDGAYLEWRPDFDFQKQTTALVKPPPSDDVSTRLLEEFTQLCILDSANRLKGQEPTNAHFEKYGRWLSLESEIAATGHSPVIGKRISKFLSLTSSERSSLIDDIYSRLIHSPSRAPYAVAIAQIRDNIEGLYTGSVDPAQLLMEDDILPNIYSAINFDYAGYISSMSNSRPALRILEIGAGAGGTTEAILSQIVREGELPPYSVYTYTDISPGFFPRARERFSDAPNIEYKLFDVSNDPLSQGFEADSYDLILAPYVVHATANLQQTLKNLHKVLKPDGRLLLSEPAAIGRSPNFIFGTFASWWFGEADGREWEPFVSINRWNDELKASGFTGADNVVYDAPVPYRYWSTIITQPEARTASEKSLPVVLICEDTKSKLSSDLVEGLTKSGHSIIKKGLTEDIADQHNIIFALDLEKPFFEDISSQDWATFKSLMEKCESNPSRKLLWLLPPAQKNCQNPNAGLSIGLLRSVRSELDLSLSTLEVDPTDADLAGHVANVFNKVLNEQLSDKLLPDREFLVENNTIEVGRYIPFSIDSELWRKTQPNGVPNGTAASHTAGGALSFDPEASYIVTGGFGGLGKAICSWMAERGARFITIISRSAGRSAEDKSFIAEMKSMGCVLTPVAGPVQDFKLVNSAVTHSPKSVKGVIHLAMALGDALFPEMTHEGWKESLAPKVDGAWNLHNALKDVSLDFFVVTSSIVSTITVPGQANYNAANTFLEAFCQYRNGLGLTASAIAVSPIDDIGVVVGNEKARRNLRSNGLQFLTEREVLEYIHLGILHRGPTPIIMGLHSDTHLDDAANHVAWKKDRRMGLYHNTPKKEGAEDDSGEGDGFREFIADATVSPSKLDAPESAAFLAFELGKRVYTFMLKPVEEVDISLSLVDVGLDSLMAVELRRLWNQMFGTTISVLEIMSLGALENYGKLAAKGLKQRLLEG